MKYSAQFWQRIVLIQICTFLAACGGLAPPDQNVNLPSKQNTNITAAAASPIPTAMPVPIIAETPTVAPTEANVDVSTNVNSSNVSSHVNSSANLMINTNVELSNNATATVTIDKLIIPVAGIKPENLQNTFKDARNQGRVHDAIDIMAAQGTPVLAAADGEIARFFDSERGGITIYQFSRDKKFVYYYAHLRARADGLQEHQFVKQGTIIGYVGDTGNAGAGNFHLHFAIWTVDDPKHYWDGTNINPYPLLKH